MKKAFPLSIAAVIFVTSLAVAGCSDDGPSSGLNDFLSALRDGNRTLALTRCYDKNSFQSISDGLEGITLSGAMKIGDVKENGVQQVRKKGYSEKKVTSVQALLKGPKADLDNRYKPLVDKANAELGNTQKELAAAVAQLAYSADTYGRDMPQYYAEQVRINAVKPRVNRAQAKVNQLNGQYQAELQELTANAEAQHNLEKDEREKALAKNLVSLPTCDVEVVFGRRNSTDRKLFKLVKDIKWKVYSLSEIR